jgi:hypothetical protein
VLLKFLNKNTIFLVIKEAVKEAALAATEDRALHI